VLIPILLTIYCLFILLASLFGGWLPMVIRLTHAGTQMVMSFVAGLMLGVALFIMLPHAAEGAVSLDRALEWMMVGLLTMFFLLRAFHFHQHGPIAAVPETDQDEADPLRRAAVLAVLHDHDHDHDHDHGHNHAHGTETGRQRGMSWAGAGIGLALHSMLDGVALAAAVQVEADDHVRGILLGFGTFLAVLLHKPLDSMTVSTLMAAGGWSVGWRQAINAIFAFLVPVGVGLFYLTLGQSAVEQSAVVAAALAFSAGVFLCISLGDLLPELQFHAHDRIKLSTLLLLGVGTAYVTGIIDRAGHQHGHVAPPAHGGAPEGDDPAGHDHSGHHHGHQH
jgi:zinc and cadmium transporter